ncbi:hypothetical protein FF38_13125 [Lucilia cuprina]|uniref:PHD-type domain-containing protein n=1 Tax=Lucilia cuprina TaxID=7375 RepID=A0A0L0CL40_LUCCU|nr:hypothetical protein CVS40_1277 [Lucilia cuprina]KNC33078.1 hypothetical protein FF38_13125 [Lucilia cuprina]
MPSKAPPTGALSCFKCKTALNRSDKKIKCGFCRKSFHINCAIAMTPGLTKEMAENMVEYSEALLFKCETCKSGNTPNLSDVVAKLNDMENRIEQLPNQVSTEISIHLEEMSTKINNCLTKIDNLEEKTSTKIKQLQIENNSLQRQLNRADITLAGIPSKLNSEKLIQLVMNIGKHYNIDLSESEINTCCWIQKKKSVLIKFNNIFKRDLIMKKYYENHDLKLSHIYKTNSATADTNDIEAGETENGNEIESRVFLNDNLTKTASRIKYLCRKLMREKKIKKFKLFNWNEPQAKLTFDNGSEKLVNVEELLTI